MFENGFYWVGKMGSGYQFVNLAGAFGKSVGK